MYRKLEVWIKFFIRHGKHKRLKPESRSASTLVAMIETSIGVNRVTEQ